MFHHPSQGFTLVEMAIVMLVVALLLGSGLSVVSTQIDQQKISDTKKALDEAKEALIGFAASTTPPHLPCPDRTAGAGANDGQEDRVGAACAVPEGNLPWITLGITGLDAWGHRFRYRVTTPAFTNNTGPTGIQLSSIGTLIVNDNSAGIVTLAQNVPAVILSHGKNGWGATSSGGAILPLPTGANELENTNGDNTFLGNKMTEETAAVGGEFDDIVTWLPRTTLISRLIQAGIVLPP